MLLKNLLSSIKPVRVEGLVDREIAGIAYDSRRVKKDFLFVAMRGEKANGETFAANAIDQGAVALAGETLPEGGRATRIVVENARTALGDLAAAFYKRPADHLKIAGITGTNGKTTTAFLLKHVCESALLRCGLIGTVRYEVGERRLPAPRTTPESLDLQELLYQIRSAGCRAAVMEVSSHALMQERVRHIGFDAAIFTNLTQDHLDYHSTMENYFEAKARLFTGLQAGAKKQGKAIINMDDRFGVRLVEMLQGGPQVITFGVHQRANFRASNLRMDFSGASYQLDAGEKSYLVRLPHIGRFNMYNSLGALAAASVLGIDVRTAVLSLASAPPVPGRLEAVAGRRQFKVFVDYAHTSDALLNVMRTLRDLSPNRLIVVFGCGGDRDRAKRPLMGAAVNELADWGIITSDNPRSEAPEAIAADIERGFTRRNYEVILDRKAAIFQAVAMARPRDIILVAGKGHEASQEFAGHLVPFDDVSMAREALEEKPVEMKN